MRPGKQLCCPQENDVVITPDERFDYGETRFILIGILKSQVVVVAYTERGEKSVSYQLEKQQKMNKSTSSNKSQTDWERLEAVEDENIDLSDIPELTPEMFAKAVVKRGLKAKENKAQLTIRVDRDVLAWFKLQGCGYQTRINSLLRAYMEANISNKKSSGRRA